MSTDAHFLDHIAELARLGERLSNKKMFGEYALYVDGKVIAFACDNSLFVKPSPAAATLAPELPMAPPYPGAKDHVLADALLDEPERLRQLLLETAVLMPAPKPKTPKKAAGTRTDA